MATANELARAEAQSFDFQMQFYVGGPREWGSLSGIVAGGAYTATASTTTTGDVTASSTSVPVVSTSGFTTGTAVIAPTETDEEYEIFQYGSTTGSSFDDLQRLYGDGLSAGVFHGTHASGATVSEWIDITNLVTGLELTMGESDSIGTWSATVKGQGYNSRLIARGNTMLAMWRFRPEGSPTIWSSWVVAFLGYIKTTMATDTHLQEKSWRATVEGVAQYLAETDAPAHHFGRMDLATGRSVTVSGTLVDPYLERNSGEYLGYVSLDGENLVDGDLATVWISDDVPTVSEEATIASYFSINEVYLRVPTGQQEVQWIEIFYQDPADTTDGVLNYYCITNSQTTWAWPGEWREKTGPDNNYLRIRHGNRIGSEGEFALFVSNRARFEERWGVVGSAYVFDWRDIQVGDFELDPAGDYIGWYCSPTMEFESLVWFGSISPGRIGALGDFVGYDDDWTGATITVPPLGHSFRRNPCGTKTSPDMASNFLEDESNPSPGMSGTDDPEWFSIELGGLGIELDQALAIDETDEMFLNGTLGLTATGYVMIEAEVIAYTGRDDDGDRLTGLTRGVGATDPAAHLAESPVTQYEDDLSVDAHLVRQVQWRRQPVLNGGTLVVPSVFRILFSTSNDPIYPDDADWDADWRDYWDETAVIDVTSFPATATEWSGVPPGGTVRARHVMMVIREMSDGGRAKMNEFHVYAATGEVLSGDTVEGTTELPYSGEVIQYLLCENFGLDPAAVTLTDPGMQFGELPTTQARYLQVIRDLCKKTGASVYFNLDDTVEHRFSPWYPLRTLPSVEITWDRESARWVDLSAPNMHNVSQVILRVRNQQEDRQYEVRYPPTPTTLGSELVQDDVCVGSVTDALLMAEQMFRRRNGPLSATVVPVGPAEWVRPGQRHLITWTLDDEGTLLQGRNFVVQQVRYSIDFGVATSAEYKQKRWDCSIGLQELLF